MSGDVLALADIATGAEWMPVHADSGVLTAYEALLGVSPGEVPAGIVIVWARRAFSRGRSLPAGGVLLAVDVELIDPPPLPSGPDTCMIGVEVRHREGGRPVVTIVVALRAGPGGPFARVSFVLLWPELP